MFGLGIPEILFILLLAIIILGPEHMPKAAELLGRWSSKVRSAATSLSEAVSQDEDLREIHHSMNTVRSELSTAKQELLRPVTETRQALMEPITDVQETVRQAREELRHISESATVVGRGNDDGVGALSSQDSEPVPEESDFMHKPMSWFQDDPIDGEMVSEKKPREVVKSYRLALPRLLPSHISRLVMRKRMVLKPVLAMDFVHARIVLGAPVSGRAFCRQIKLSPVRHHVVHTVVVLSSPHPPERSGGVGEALDSHV